MSYKVVYTDNFAREARQLAKKHRSLKNDLEHLIQSLEQDPAQGRSLGKSCYKIRMAISSKGKGKSGGARVVTHVYVSGHLVYLLSIFDKSDKDTLSDKELDALIKML